MAIDWEAGSLGRGLIIERLVDGQPVHEVHNWVTERPEGPPFIVDVAVEFDFPATGSDDVGYLVFNIDPDGVVGDFYGGPMPAEQGLDRYREIVKEADPRIRFHEEVWKFG